MKIETLKRKNKYLYIGAICEVILLSILVFNVSRAKYKTTESIELARGTINYTAPDFNLMAVYLEKDGGYQLADNIPTNGYTLNKEQSYCKVNENTDLPITIEYNNGSINIFNLTQKGTKCYIYLDAKKITIKDILASKTISTRTDFSTVLTEDTTGTIYSAEDDYGTSYYYAGAPTDNWVKFAGFYWRIIRINGDGTLRLIYNGPTTDQTGDTTQIGISAFNSPHNDNMYVGYQYTNGEVHGRGTDSIIKGVLDNWYNNNLTNYSNYIATGNGATFCNDRQPSTSFLSMNGSGGTGKTVTGYAAHIRFIANKAPTLKCADTRDRFATSVGLITADEIAYAGGVWMINNTSYYLYTTLSYWAMSPCYFNNDDAGEFIVGEGWLYSSNVYYMNGVRPVINLKSNTVFVGSGTSSDPYIVT